jgi:hypothetical protein
MDECATTTFGILTFNEGYNTFSLFPEVLIGWDLHVASKFISAESGHYKALKLAIEALAEIN